MVVNICYLALFDWDNTDAANDLVSSLYLLLFNTSEAFVSISLLVWLLELDWLSTDAARDFCTCDEDGSFNVDAAFEANAFEDCFELVMLTTP